MSQFRFQSVSLIKNGYGEKHLGISLLHTEDLIYRIDDSPQGVEATQHRKDMLDGVCNGGQLKQRVEEV